MIALASHVDDCSAIASSVELEEEIKTELRKVFEISDLGKINWILGIGIKRDRIVRTVGPSQKSYINSMLSRFGEYQARRNANGPKRPLSTSQSR
jgi:hypothetical protein